MAEIEPEFVDATGLTRKAHYGKDGEQPWDVIVRAGWGAQFAAANVLKYLRRVKSPEDVDKARWYWARLRELAEPAGRATTGVLDAFLARITLISLLTDAELATLRGVKDA